MPPRQLGRAQNRSGLGVHRWTEETLAGLLICTNRGRHDPEHIAAISWALKGPGHDRGLIIHNDRYDPATANQVIPPDFSTGRGWHTLLDSTCPVAVADAKLEDPRQRRCRQNPRYTPAHLTLQLKAAAQLVGGQLFQLDLSKYDKEGRPTRVAVESLNLADLR